MLAVIVLAPVAVLTVIIVFHSHFGEAAANRNQAVYIQFARAGADAGLPAINGPLDASRPLVVIDAGHGGHDPGAQGRTDEKDLTLALAKTLQAQLLAGGGIRVALTRSEDRFLLLGERWGLARRLHADLFVSIHADSSTDAAASGATVYTLSRNGSNAEAGRLAIGENHADTINGVPLGDAGHAVAAILVDLSQQRTQRQSEQFARLVLREGQGVMPFRDQALQSAAFVVLKSPDTPSVLLEAGYISNPHDAAWLRSAAGRDAFATTIDRAIRMFFARQSAPLAIAAP